MLRDLGLEAFLRLHRLYDRASPAAIDLMAGLLHPDPGRRLSPSGALRHRWFAQ